MFKNILISLLLLIMGTTFTSFYKNKSKELENQLNIKKKKFLN